MTRLVQATVLFLVASWALWTPPSSCAGDKSPQKKEVAEKAAKYEYPSGKRLKDFNAGTIYQSIATTPDDVDKVDKWYRKKLDIPEGTGTGVSTDSKIIEDSDKTRGYQLLRSLYVTGAVRTYIVREEVFTVVVVVTRDAAEKSTEISLTFIPEKAK